MLRIIYLSALLLPLLTLQAHASVDRVYMSPMEESRWVLVTSSAIRCEIEHDIPRFGKAVFYQESGRSLKLRVETRQTYQRDLDISFRSVTANWKGIHTESEIANLKSSGKNQLVNVVDDAARHAYFELEQGYQPSLFFNDQQDAMNRVAVILSTVNFRDAEADFGQCIARLHPDHFDDVRLSRVHFDFDEEFPTLEEEERALSRMLAYLKVDDSVRIIRIAGHADYKGTDCYNDSLSARRAWYVYDYLVQSGIEPERLQVEFFGESQPLKQGRDDHSRALNRRVTVTLQK